MSQIKSSPRSIEGNKKIRACMSAGQGSSAKQVSEKRRRDVYNSVSQPTATRFSSAVLVHVAQSKNQKEICQVQLEQRKDQKPGDIRHEERLICMDSAAGEQIAASGIINQILQPQRKIKKKEKRPISLLARAPTQILSKNSSNSAYFERVSSIAHGRVVGH